MRLGPRGSGSCSSRCRDPPSRRRPEAHAVTRAFLFATRIENSNPTIRHGTHRVDEMETCGHYARWREDFELVEEMGIQFLRYGPPIHRTWVGDGGYDWEFADLTFGDLRRRGLVPIVDLCHF